MWCPQLTEEEKELVEKLESLPDDRFVACFHSLSIHDCCIDINRESEKDFKENDIYFGQGYNKAHYYAQMWLANATVDLELAKENLMEVMRNKDKFNKDAPIYWQNVKTSEGWKKVLVGDVARDYTKKHDPNTGRVELTFPDGEVIKS
jgi:hypothetical protein